MHFGNGLPVTSTMEYCVSFLKTRKDFDNFDKGEEGLIQCIYMKLLRHDVSIANPLANNKYLPTSVAAMIYANKIG